jgi:hypothetical protein
MILSKQFTQFSGKWHKAMHQRGMFTKAIEFVLPIWNNFGLLLLTHNTWLLA